MKAVKTLIAASALSVMLGLGFSGPADAVTMTESFKLFGFTIYEETTTICSTDSDGNTTCTVVSTI